MSKQVSDDFKRSTAILNRDNSRQLRQSFEGGRTEAIRLLLTHISDRTDLAFPLAGIERTARRRGIHVIVDLMHVDSWGSKLCQSNIDSRSLINIPRHPSLTPASQVLASRSYANFTSWELAESISTKISYASCATSQLPRQTKFASQRNLFEQSNRPAQFSNVAR